MARTWTPSQEKAITHKGKTLLISAAAGSGKTSVLTERIIRSLLDPENPADLSRMLVVTFTRAAAAELKSRISAALSEALALDPGNQHLSKQLFLLGGAQISTIDSFFQKIVRANFDALELPATFRIASAGEVSPIAAGIMDGLINEFYASYECSSEKSAFDRILSNPFAIAIDHLMSGRSDGKLTPMLLAFLEELASYPQGISLLEYHAELLEQGAEQDFFSTSYGQVMVREIRENTNSYLAALQKAEEYLSVDHESNRVYSSLVGDDIVYCQSILAALNAYETERAVFEGLLLKSFPGKRNKPGPILTLQNRRNKWREMIKQYIPLLEHTPAEIKAEMLETADLCRMLFKLYSEFEKRLMEEKKAHGMLEFHDIRALLYKLLTANDGAPSQFAKDLSAQYDAVYIDEYQDVDFVQDGIFSMIGGDRRFMVGDIKQSIYGFRGGEPSIFASYRKRFPLWDEPQAESAPGNCIFMSENFRCDRPVVEFTNLVCSFLFSACEDSIQYRPEDDLICSKRSPEALPAGHPVKACIEVFEKKSAKAAETEEESAGEEILWVGGEIKRLLAEERLDDGSPISPADIAILVRTKAQGRLYQKELERLSIPVAVTASADILSDPLLIDLVNLLRAIDNPYRDIPLSEFLISDIGGFTLEELSTIRESAPASHALYEAMETAAKHTDPNGLTEKTASMIACLERLRDEACSQPADRFLRTLYREDRLVQYAETPAFLFVYEQARAYQRSSWCGLYGFLQHFEKLKEGGAASAAGFSGEESAVSIMTVHHSKGLEFPVVFLCSTGAGFNKQDLTKNMIYHKDIGFCSKLYSQKTGDTCDTLLRILVKQQIKRDQNEENIRTLYVALTRARERLIVTGTVGSKWDSFLTAAENVEKGNAADILNCNSYLSWIIAAWTSATGVHKNSFASLHFHSLGSVRPATSVDSDGSCNSAPEVKHNPLAEHYQRILEKQTDFVYPLAFLQGLPTKAAASRLQADLLDLLQDESENDQALLAQMELMRTTPKSFDHLLEEESTPKATDFGTATHSFLEFCHFERLYSTGVEEEIKLLTEAGFLHPKNARLINRKQLSAFQESDLLSMILSAVNVLREQQFGLYVPMSELTASPERKQQMAEHTLFVQGSIDLLLEMPDKQLILVDYKTDHISDAERNDPALLAKSMHKKHGVQLSYYAKAVKELMGQAPDRVCIYSLPLGRLIDIIL